MTSKPTGWRRVALEPVVTVAFHVLIQAPSPRPRDALVADWLDGSGEYAFVRLMRHG